MLSAPVAMNKAHPMREKKRSLKTKKIAFNKNYNMIILNNIIFHLYFSLVNSILNSQVKPFKFILFESNFIMRDFCCVFSEISYIISFTISHITKICFNVPHGGLPVFP